MASPITRSEEVILDLSGMNSWYGSVHVLHDINFYVKAGELVAVIGANGAGKSTTLKSIAGLVPRCSGEMTYQGNKLIGLNPPEIVKRGVALVPEGRWIFSDLTVEENLRIGAFSRPPDEIAFSLVEQQTLFPILRERIRQKAGTLSGGEQQMLAISRALMSKPKLLLLDEPSLGLAPQIVESVFSLIKQINKTGVSIVLVEQNSRAALAIADRGYVLSTGKVKLEGSGEQLLSDPKVQAIYLGNIN